MVGLTLGRVTGTAARSSIVVTVIGARGEMKRNEENKFS
jgi:hypothetical protein